jgi:hypothetical protein
MPLIDLGPAPAKKGPKLIDLGPAAEPIPKMNLMPRFADPQGLPEQSQIFADPGLRLVSKSAQKPTIDIGKTLKLELSGPALFEKAPIAGAIPALFNRAEYEEAKARLKADDEGQLPYKSPIRFRSIRDARMMGEDIDPTDPYALAVYTTRQADEKIIESFEGRKYQPKTTGGAITSGVINLPTYIAEFALTGGQAQIGKKIGRRAGLRLFGSKTASRLLGWITGATVRGGIGFAPRALEETVERRYTKDESLGDSIAKAWAGKIIEAGAETTGETITKGLSKLPLARTLIPKLQKAWSKATGGTAGQFVNKLLTKGGYSSLIGEIGEERVETILRAVANTDDFGAGKDSTIGERLWAGILQDAQNFPVELGVLSAPAGVRAAAGIITRQPDKTVMPFRQPATTPVKASQRPVEARTPVSAAQTAPESATGQIEAQPQAEGKQAYEMTREEYVGKPPSAEEKVPIWKVNVTYTVEQNPAGPLKGSVEYTSKSPPKYGSKIPTAFGQGRVASKKPKQIGTKKQVVNQYGEEAERWQIRDIDHRVAVQRALQENKPVPLEVLQEYKGEKWADEAIAKMVTAPPPAAQPDLANMTEDELDALIERTEQDPAKLALYESAIEELAGRTEPISEGVTEDATEIRKDERRIQEAGIVGQGGEAQGRENLQRPEEAGAETGDTQRGLKDLGPAPSGSRQAGFVDLTPIAEAGQQIKTTGEKAQKLFTRFTGLESKVQQTLIEYEEQLRQLPKEAAKQSIDLLGKLTTAEEDRIIAYIEKPSEEHELPASLKKIADTLIAQQDEMGKILKELGYPADWPKTYIKRLQSRLEHELAREEPDTEFIEDLQNSIAEAQESRYLHHYYDRLPVSGRISQWFSKRITKKPQGVLGRKIPTYRKAEELGLKRAPLAVSHAHLLYEIRKAKEATRLLEAINKNPNLSAWADEAHPEGWRTLDEKAFPQSVQRQMWSQEGKAIVKTRRRVYPPPVADALEELVYSRGNHLAERAYDKTNFALKIIGFYNPLVMGKNDLGQLWRVAGTFRMLNPKIWWDALKIFATKNDEYQFLRKSGLFNNVVNYTPAATEITRKMLDKIRLTKGQRAYNWAKDWLNPLHIFKDLRRMNEATTWNLDEIIRIAAWNATRNSGLTKGMTEFEKVVWVNDAMVNYAKLPRETKRWLGKAFFVPTYRIGNFRFWWGEVNRIFKGQYRHFGPVLRTVVYKMFVQWGLPAIITAAIAWKLGKKKEVWTERGYRVVIRDPKTGKETVYALSDPLLEGAKLTQRPGSQSFMLNLAPIPSFVVRLAAGPRFKGSKDPLGEFFKLGTPIYRDVLNWKDPDKTVPQKILTQLAIAYVYTREQKDWTEDERKKAKEISARALAKALSIWTDWKTQARDVDKITGFTNLEMKFMSAKELKSELWDSTLKDSHHLPQSLWSAKKGQEEKVKTLKAELKKRTDKMPLRK